MFVEPLSVIKDPLTRLLAKGVNQKCMIRLFGKGALKTFKQSEEALVTVRMWLLCSLLGNYSHVRPSTRPKSPGRRILYDWLGGYEPCDFKRGSPFLSLTKLCPHLILFVCREQLVYLMGDIPALRVHFDTFSDYNQYRDIVVDCMDEIRGWVSSHLELPCSPIHAFLKGEENAEFFQVIIDILEYENRNNPHQEHSNPHSRISRCVSRCYHKRLCEINYKRPNSNVMSVIRSLKSSKKKEDVIPMVEMPGYTHQESKAPVLEDLVDDDEDEEEEGQRCTAFDFSPFLPPDHVKAVDKVISALLESSLTPSQAFYCCIDVFEACGLTVQQTAFVKNLVRDLQTGAVSKKPCEMRFRALQRKLPHAYNLLQAAAELMREKQRFRLICTLPLDIAQNQLKAVQQRFGTQDGEYLSDSLLFYFCPICDCIYSLLRDFNGSFVNNYRYGLRDAQVDYLTREVFCRRGKTNHRGVCGKDPLSRIPLLGVMMFYCNKRIMLCPQPGCGMCMVFDAKQAIFNEFGALCYDCSHKASFKRLDYGIDFTTRCVRCNTSVPSPEKMFLYPHGAMMCNRCSKRYTSLNEHFYDPDVIRRCKDRKSVVAEIIAYYQQREKFRKERLLPQWNKSVKRSRRATRHKERR